MSDLHHGPPCRQIDAHARSFQAMARSAAIPDRPDRGPRPARTEAAAVVAAAVKAGPAEIVQVAVVPVILWDWIDIPMALVAARHARSRSFLGVRRNGVIRRLTIARQEAVSVPAWRRPFMNRLSRRDGRQQRQDDSDQWKHEARHLRTIDGRPLRGDSNLSARRYCFRFTREPTALRRLAELARLNSRIWYLISSRPRPAREISPLPARSCRGSCRRPCRRSSRSRH